MVQIIKTEKFVFNLYKIDSGAFGETAELEIFDNTEILIEKIDLRGEDYFPKIDSIVNENIFISYSYPTQTEKLEFEQVVLGEKLINNTNLRFNYNFLNIKQ